MGSFGSFWGHYSIETASGTKSDLRFEISCPNYIGNQSLKVHFISPKLTLLAEGDDKHGLLTSVDSPQVITQRKAAVNAH